MPKPAAGVPVMRLWYAERMTRRDVAADRDPVNDRIGAFAVLGRVYENAEEGECRDGGEEERPRGLLLVCFEEVDDEESRLLVLPPPDMSGDGELRWLLVLVPLLVPPPRTGEREGAARRCCRWL